MATSPLGLQLKPRRCIKLNWGYLYTQESFAPVRKHSQSQLAAVSDSKVEDWTHIAASAMTSMVITLGFVNLLQDLFEKNVTDMKWSHHLNLLSSLESMHWHARSFNEDQNLRATLRTRSFMKFPDNPTRLPNLLEQEVRSATLIVRISVKLFSINDPALHEMVEPFIKRYFTIVTNRFMDLDDTLFSANPVSPDLVAAYQPAVVSGISGLCHLSLQQFRGCLSWLGPLITRLITCHDREVRGVLQQLHASLLIPSLVLVL